MRITSDRLTRLRWLLLGAASAGACGGTVHNAPDDDGGAGTHTSGGVGVAGGTNVAGKTNRAGAASGGVAGRSVGGAAGSAGNAGSGGDAGSGGASVPHGECVDPQPANAGFVTCGNGLVHRVEQSECQNKLPMEPVTCGVEPNTYVCDGTQREACGSPGGGTPPATSCAVGCVVDADCGAGKICLCGPQIGGCVAAACTVDADCGDGYLCRLVTMEQGIGCGATVAFQCQLPEDGCNDVADCGTGGGFGQRCQPSTVGDRLRCEPVAGAACGRPFLVNGAPRLACLSTNADWAETFATDLGELDSATRAALAEGWNQLGLMEHASVAAFARFTLQLLELGAPHALVRESNQAICDETRHAQLCFGLAASFGSTAAGPGKLDCQGALARSSLADVALDTFLEGCIGETVAALEASEALAGATVPAVRQVLEQIAEDEARHAALAWRFVAWSSAQSPGLVESLRARWERERERAAHARTALAQRASTTEDLSAGGIVSDLARAELRLHALREVVGPCLEALPGALPAELATAALSVG